MLTVSDYIGLIGHAIGKTPDTVDSRHDLYQTLNRAGRAITNCHAWSWRTGKAILPCVNGQDYLDLPEDYGRFLTATVPTSGSFPLLQVVSLEEIYRRRSMTMFVSTTGILYAAFDYWERPTTRDTAPTPRAQLWPTPNADGVPTVTLSYERAWVDVSAADVSEAPPIPPAFEQALVDAARAFACALEAADIHNPSPAPDVRQLPEIIRLMSGDDPSGSGWTSPRGGAGSRMRRSRSSSAQENLIVPMQVN